MSENRLDKALEELHQESVDAATLDAVRARAWQTVSAAAGAGCAEFRQDLRGYLSGSLTNSRRTLVADHLSRCSACRTALAEMRGDRQVIAMPQRSSSSWRRWGTLAAAAALVLSLTYVGRDSLDAWMAPAGSRATVVSVNGGVYRLSGGALDAGTAIGDQERIRTGPDAHAVLRLADGSTVHVNERTEMFVTAAWSGQAIHVQRGDIIVEAAKQRRGHLRVLTRDSIASVKGTVFAVSAGMAGSVVSVVEGSVAVSQPGREVLLRPGQQAASNPVLATSVAQAVSWSPNADEYLQLLASFAKIEREINPFSGPVRTTSALLPYLPIGTFVYGAIPNPGGKIGQGLAAAEQQAFDNAAFRAWWSSGKGVELRQIVDRVQSASSMLGDEVVFFMASSGLRDEVPIVVARIQPGKEAVLASALDSMFADNARASQPYSLSEGLMVVSDSPLHVAWAVSHLGQGARSPFAAAIGDRYRRGAGWLIAVNAAPMIEMASGHEAPPVALADLTHMKFLFLEQRAPEGAEEHEVTVTFDGARSGMASWLADGGSGGAAEYIPSDALLAGYVSMREPGQLFNEFTALMASQQPSFTGDLAGMEEKLGAGFAANLTAAVGTEAAFALHGFSTSGPTWTLVALANDAAAIDNAFTKIVNTVNAELPPGEQTKRCVLTRESAGGRWWSTLRVGGLPFGVTWTYEGGYLVLASDRGNAERAIATRNGGAALVWTQRFQQQLPASAGLHPSAFVWLNTNGALGIFSAFTQNPAAANLLSGRDPVLVVFDGKPEEIHAASRARLSGAIMDVMLLENLSRTPTPAPSATMRR